MSHKKEYLEEMRQLVLQEFHWINEDYETRRKQEAQVEKDLLEIQMAEVTVKMVLIYIQMVKDGESQNIVAEARETVASALNTCEMYGVIDGNRIQGYRNILK